MNRTVTPLDSAKDSKNIITYGSLTGQLLGVTSLWYDSKTKTILEADIKLNATLPLVNGQQRGGYDVRSVLTHEFGHFIGLGHVSDRTHTMYPGVHDDSTIYRTLCSGDIAGARRAYGTR